MTCPLKLYRIYGPLLFQIYIACMSISSLQLHEIISLFLILKIQVLQRHLQPLLSGVRNQLLLNALPTRVTIRLEKLTIPLFLQVKLRVFDMTV